MEMGLNMDVPHIAASRREGDEGHAGGAGYTGALQTGQTPFRLFPHFVTAVVHNGVAVEVWFDEYLKHGILRPHDLGSVLRAWKESGLSELLDVTRRDAEVQGLVAEFHTRVRESRRQEVDGVKA